MITEVEQVSLDELKRDLGLRGYSDIAITELLQCPVLLIPGPITAADTETPVQKLTNHIAFFAKDLEREGLATRVVERRNVARQYIEERHAHVDLGTIVVSMSAVQQLGNVADIAQILDFLLNLMRLKFTSGRTKELTPAVKFDLELHDGKKAAICHIEGPADALSKAVTPKFVDALASIFKHESPDE